MADFLLYGATGYVGRGASALAVEQGLRPMLGARSETVAEIAGELGMEATVVSLDDEADLDDLLAGVPVVLNCAGPFVRTHRPLIESCLRTGTHYVDITGEPVVFEAAASLDEAARDAGVMLLPGAGFDVVPTDCLAAHVTARLPGATQLSLAFATSGPAGLPPGTVKTLLEMAATTSTRLHRVEGRVVEAGERHVRTVDFGRGETRVVLRTWGDIYLGEKSTGIPNVADYMALSPTLERQADLLDRLSWLLRWAPVRRSVARFVPTGSTPQQREASSSHVWAEATDDRGNRAASRLHGPEAGLVWTSRAALDVVRHVLSGEAPPGHQTPSTAYGPDLALEAEGVSREDLEG